MHNKRQVLLIHLINWLSYILPTLAAELSYRIWAKTYRHARPRRELPCYSSANKKTVTVQQKKVVEYHWGEGPKVLILHGWNGRASQFFTIIDTLVQAGYQVVAADQPGCGDSEGQHNGLMLIRELIEKQERDSKYAAIVAHSFGWLGAINSQPDKLSQCLVGIAPPADFSWLLEIFTSRAGLNGRVYSALKKRVQKNYGINSLDEISIRQIGPQLQLPGLVIFDSEDLKIAESQMKEILQYWPSVEKFQTDGLGHSRILHDKAVAEKILTFINHANQ